MQVPQAILDEIAGGALFVINHSGGKDSQAMTAYLRQIIPAPQLVVVHAELPGVEWRGTEAHARSTTAGLPFHTVRAGKTFLEMVERRGMFPSPQHRQCTSDLKRDPINTWLRRYAREHGYTRIVQCLGIRAEESPKRSRQEPLTLDKRMSKAGRHVLRWYPIHDWPLAWVWNAIAMIGQQAHWAYREGSSRLSCCFCIMASEADLRVAKRFNQTMHQAYIAVEKSTGFTMRPGKPLAAL